ncbi:MAG: hypothetical protein WC702_03700 [Patescibacteria group bacterium]|jgi:hypothetical protein
MSIFKDLDQLKNAIRGLLKTAPDVNTAKRWIRALPGSQLGSQPEIVLTHTPPCMHFDILGGITVCFNDDGSRDATLTIATQHDDPNPQIVSVRWAGQGPAT